MQPRATDMDAALGNGVGQIVFAWAVTDMDTDREYNQEIERWHARRIERLTAPDGWLSLIGLEWLKPGANRIGSAADNDIVLVKTPAHLGTIEWSDNALSIVLDAVDGVTIDGVAQKHAGLVDDSHAVTRAQFAGIERFPVDSAWRVVADWRPLEPPLQLATGTVIGTIENYPAPGKAVFEREGRRFELYPVLELPGDTQLFLIFADATSGKETYGAARFLYADMPRDGKLVLDFNKAYNPPCAFTPFATCPLAPPENRLDVRVAAGELKYRKTP